MNAGVATAKMRHFVIEKSRAMGRGTLSYLRHLIHRSTNGTVLERN